MKEQLDDKYKRERIKHYHTTLDSCECMSFKYRCQRFGLKCKHQIWLLDFIKKDIDNIQIEDGEDALEFVKRYNERTLNILKQKGEVYERKGKLYRL